MKIVLYINFCHFSSHNDNRLKYNRATEKIEFYIALYIYVIIIATEKIELGDESTAYVHVL